MMKLKPGDVLSGESAYLYFDTLADAPYKGAADDSVQIVATDASDPDADHFVIVTKVAQTTSGFPAGIKKGDIFCHRGSAITLKEGDECYSVRKNKDFPCTSVEMTVAKSTTSVKIQTRPMEVQVGTGKVTPTIVVNSVRVKNFQIQERIERQYFREIVTKKDGSMLTPSDPSEVHALLWVARLSGQEDYDLGIAMVVTVSETKFGWDNESAQDFPVNCSVSSIANPTLIKIYQGEYGG